MEERFEKLNNTFHELSGYEQSHIWLVKNLGMTHKITVNYRLEVLIPARNKFNKVQELITEEDINILIENI